MTSIVRLTAAAALLTVAAPALAQTAPASPQTRADLSQRLDTRFKSADANKDGFLTKAELDSVETRTRAAAAAEVAKQVDGEFAKLDSDKNGQISKAEFRKAAPQIGSTPQASAETLTRLDTDKDGKISTAEFNVTMLRAFDQVDTNKDGTLSDAERQAAAARQPQSASLQSR